MSVEQYGIRQGGIFVAKVDINPTDDGRRFAHQEAMHYMAVYGQDAPVQLWHRSKHRRWKPLGRRSFSFVSVEESDRMRRFPTTGATDER